MSGELFDSDYFKGLNSNFPSNYESLRMRLGFWYRFRKIISLIRKYKKTGKLLDVGCAHGFFVNFAKKKGFDAIGCDVSRFAVRRSRKLFPNLKILLIDVQKRTKFRKNCFDVVTALQVLEHCKNLKFVLKEIRRILKKDGIFLAAVPISELIPKERDKDKTHVWHFSLKEWISIFRKEGFSVLKIYTYLNFLRKIKPDFCETFIFLKRD